MVEMKFSGSSTENLIRQIQAFAENVKFVKEGSGKRGRHEKKETPGCDNCNLGEEQQKPVP